MIALESGAVVRVAEIENGWLGRPYSVRAAVLTPLPMRYHGNEVPR